MFLELDEYTAAKRGREREMNYWLKKYIFSSISV